MDETCQSCVQWTSKTRLRQSFNVMMTGETITRAHVIDEVDVLPLLSNVLSVTGFIFGRFPLLDFLWFDRAFTGVLSINSDFDIL